MKGHHNIKTESQNDGIDQWVNAAGGRFIREPRKKNEEVQQTGDRIAQLYSVEANQIYVFM